MPFMPCLTPYIPFVPLFRPSTSYATLTPKPQSPLSRLNSESLKACGKSLGTRRLQTQDLWGLRGVMGVFVGFTGFLWFWVGFQGLRVRVWDSEARRFRWPEEQF